MGMNVNLRIENKYIFLISGMFVFLLGIGLVIGFWDSSKTMWHSAADVKVDGTCDGSQGPCPPGTAYDNLQTVIESVNSRLDTLESASSGGSFLHGSYQGWEILPSGLMIQWGEGLSDGDADIVHSFPVPFPNAVVSVQTTVRKSGTSGAIPVKYKTTTGFTTNRPDGMDGIHLFYWTAIGH